MAGRRERSRHMDVMGVIGGDGSVADLNGKDCAGNRTCPGADAEGTHRKEKT
jgi:hypothetical protein